MDSSPMLDQSYGGRGCPSATNLWIREVLDVLEQYVSLSGVVLRIVMHYLKQQCAVHHDGWHWLPRSTTSTVQLLLRVGKADTVLEILLSRRKSRMLLSLSLITARLAYPIPMRICLASRIEGLEIIRLDFLLTL